MTPSKNMNKTKIKKNIFLSNLVTENKDPIILLHSKSYLLVNTYNQPS